MDTTIISCGIFYILYGIDIILELREIAGALFLFITHAFGTWQETCLFGE